MLGAGRAMVEVTLPPLRRSRRVAVTRIPVLAQVRGNIGDVAKDDWGGADDLSGVRLLCRQLEAW